MAIATSGSRSWAVRCALGGAKRFRIAPTADLDLTTLSPAEKEIAS